MRISQMRRALNLASRGLGAVQAVRRNRVGEWAGRQVSYTLGGRLMAWLHR